MAISTKQIFCIILAVLSATFFRFSPAMTIIDLIKAALNIAAKLTGHAIVFWLAWLACDVNFHLVAALYFYLRMGGFGSTWAIWLLDIFVRVAGTLGLALLVYIAFLAALVCLPMVHGLERDISEEDSDSEDPEEWPSCGDEARNTDEE